MMQIVNHLDPEVFDDTIYLSIDNIVYTSGIHVGPLLPCAVEYYAYDLEVTKMTS